jgi:hypothetical protein
VNNYASDKGGAIYLSNFNDFKIMGSSTFNKNSAKVRGSEVFALTCSRNLTLENVLISSNGINSISLEYVSFIAKSVSIKSN